VIEFRNPQLIWKPQVDSEDAVVNENDVREKNNENESS